MFFLSLFNYFMRARDVPRLAHNEGNTGGGKRKLREINFPVFDSPSSEARRLSPLTTLGFGAKDVNRPQSSRRMRQDNL
jgi:hypothetical protein